MSTKKVKSLKPKKDSKPAGKDASAVKGGRGRNTAR
jgi:hypothetical protein